MDSNNPNSPLVEALITLKPFLSKVEDNSIAISAIDNRLSILVEEVRKMSRIIYEGNGQPSLITRMVAVETLIAQVRDAVRDIKADDKIESTKTLERIQGVDKAFVALSLAVEDYKDKEREGREDARAKNQVMYEWKLNAIQAIGLFIITAILSWFGSEIYSKVISPAPSVPEVMTTPNPKSKVPSK